MEGFKLTIVQGSTFSHAVRWETTPIIYKPITGITKAAPAIVTCTAHGIPDGWRVLPISVLGMTQINCQNDPPRDKDYLTATVIDVNTIELNSVNSSGFSTYMSGGYLQFYTPHDLASYTARMTIKNRIGGTMLATLTTENSRITVDDTTKLITLTISATDTAAFSWEKGVYDLELVSPSGVVTSLMSGTVRLIKEVTTS